MYIELALLICASYVSIDSRVVLVPSQKFSLHLFFCMFRCAEAIAQLQFSAFGPLCGPMLCILCHCFTVLFWVSVKVKVYVLNRTYGIVDVVVILSLHLTRYVI